MELSSLRLETFSYFLKKKFSYISGNGVLLYFPKKGFSYISRNGSF